MENNNNILGPGFNDGSYEIVSHYFEMGWDSKARLFRREFLDGEAMILERVVILGMEPISWKPICGVLKVGELVYGSMVFSGPEYSFGAQRLLFTPFNVITIEFFNIPSHHDFRSQVYLIGGLYRTVRHKPKAEG